MGLKQKASVRRLLFGGAIPALLMAAAAPVRAQSIQELRELSLEELANLNVSSVSKSNEALKDAPAAVFVITHDAIARSGATTLPELLRLAPNLYVAQITASQYTITARGLSGNQDAQSFSNKLLVMIDGRSVYSPLYSGVYWDMQDVVPEDIERIEVVSGPGAALWGANAVNGVINIITKGSGETQGLLVSADGGNRERSGSLRYGARLSPTLTARAYLRGLDQDQTRLGSGAPANDDWWRVQGGFRLDWAASGSDAVTLQGDLSNTRSDHAATADDLTRSRNLLARWTRTAENGATLAVQGYIDRSARESKQAGGDFTVDTYDLYFQHNNAPGDRDDFVWGGGIRASDFVIHGSSAISVNPSHRTLLLGNLFAQYGLAFGKHLKLTAGLKAEDDPYVGISVLPSMRLSWKPDDAVLLWSAVSRAVRSPTPFDRDVVETYQGSLFLIGDADFRTEKLTAFEAGTRIQAGQKASLSLSAFYNLYDDLRSIEPAPGGLLPIRWGNGLKGNNYGLEAWGSVSVARWWTLGGGLTLLHDDFRYQRSASRLVGISQLGNDPARQARLTSSFKIGSVVTIDADLRYVGPLPDPHVPSYTELGGRIAWRLSDRLQLSVSGLNLLHAWHQELPLTTANQVPRKILAGLKWRM